MVNSTTLFPLSSSKFLRGFQVAISFFLLRSAATAVIGNDVIADPEDIHNLTTPPPYIYEDWKDWETWEASSDVVQAFPYVKMGNDLDGLPVYLVEFGKWDYRQWARKPEEKLVEFWKFFEQFVRRQEKDAKGNNGQGMVQLVDWDGFALSHHSSPHAIKLAMRMFSLQVRMDSGMKYGVYVNVNFAAETFINAMRPFMGSFLEKYEVCGTRMEKCKPILFSKIGPDQLPPIYGGTNKDWKPVPFNEP